MRNHTKLASLRSKTRLATDYYATSLHQPTHLNNHSSLDIPLGLSLIEFTSNIESQALTDIPDE